MSVMCGPERYSGLDLLLLLFYPKGTAAAARCAAASAAAARRAAASAAAWRRSAGLGAALALVAPPSLCPLPAKATAPAAAACAGGAAAASALLLASASAALQVSTDVGTPLSRVAVPLPDPSAAVMPSVPALPALSKMRRSTLAPALRAVAPGVPATRGMNPRRFSAASSGLDGTSVRRQHQRRAAAGRLNVDCSSTLNQPSHKTDASTPADKMQRR